MTNALEDEYDSQVINIGLIILNLLITSAEYVSENFVSQDSCQRKAEIDLPTTKSEGELKNILVLINVNFISSSKRPSHYVSENVFFSNYNKSNFEQIKNSRLVPNETLNLENLIQHFKKVTFDVSVNEKDCY